MTDELTGMGSGTSEFIKNTFDKVLKAANKVEIPLEELPVATYDEQKRVFTYKEKGGVE